MPEISPDETEATYHLGYEQDGAQPVISIHTDPAHIEELAERQDRLATIQEYFGLHPFTLDEGRFGYSGVGTMSSSKRVVGWSAIKFALPPAESESRYLGTPTPRIIPAVTTMSVVLNHLYFLEGRGIQDSDNPQLVEVNLSNTLPLNEHYSGHLRARLHPELLRRLDSIPDIEPAQERVKQALYSCFQYAYGHASEDEFRVSLGDDLSFDYPGDGAGFFDSRRRHIEELGLSLNAANNDYPIQQLSILGGLAALNDIALEQSEPKPS